LIVLVAWYCNLGVTPLWIAIVANIIMFVAVTGRMISASALMTAVPDPSDRGAFMSIQSSVQQISGGFATALAGLIVVQTTTGALQNYDLLGYIVVVATMITVAMMSVINKSIQQKIKVPKSELVPVFEESK
jgi:MFS family permease